MLLQSLLYNKYNRFYFDFTKLKPVALFYLSFLLAFNAFTESDFEIGDNNLIFLSSLEEAMSEKAKKKADALTNYALGCIEFKKSFVLSEAALKRFVEAVKNDPKGSVPLSILRRHWIGTDKHTELIEHLLPIAQQNPNAVKLTITVSKSLRKEKRIDEAIELLNNSLKAIGLDDSDKGTDSERSELLLDLVLLYGNKKEWSKGEELLDNAFEYPGMKDSLTARLAAAKFYSYCADQGPDGFFAGWHKRRYREKLEKNLELVEKECEKSKLRSISLFPILEIYKRYEMSERAENLALSQLLLDPKDPQAFILLGKVFEDNEDFSNAYRVWDIIVNTSRYPNLKKNWKRLSLFLKADPNLHYQLGYAALKCERWQEAVKAFDWGLLKNPNDATALFQLGFAYLKMGKFRKAIYKFEKIKGLPDSLYFIAYCYQSLEEYEKAFIAMQKAESLAKKLKEDKFLDRDFYMEFAFISDKAKHMKKTETILKNLIKESPDDALLNNFLGYLWADHNKNLDQAEKLIQKALDEESANPAYLDSMAWVLYKKKDYENALDYIEESIENSEDPIPDSVITDHAGDIHAALGNKKEALKYWEIALETYSTDTDSEEISKKINQMKKDLSKK